MDVWIKTVVWCHLPTPGRKSTDMGCTMFNLQLWAYTGDGSWASRALSLTAAEPAPARPYSAYTQQTRLLRSLLRNSDLNHHRELNRLKEISEKKRNDDSC